MQTKSYKTIDRTGWPSGEWDDEPDKMQWPDSTTGLPCLAVRQSPRGHWCGYVGVSEDHPTFLKDFMDVDADVHDGLTYSAACAHSEEARGICHVPASGETDNVWWFGFDCAQYGDYCPLDLKRAKETGYPFDLFPAQTYRSLAYVQSECASLAQQLHQMR